MIGFLTLKGTGLVPNLLLHEATEVEFSCLSFDTSTVLLEYSCVDWNQRYAQPYETEPKPYTTIISITDVYYL